MHNRGGVCAADIAAVFAATDLRRGSCAFNLHFSGSVLRTTK